MVKYDDSFAWRAFRSQIGAEMENLPAELLRVAEAARRQAGVTIRKARLEKWDEEVAIAHHLFNITLQHLPDYYPMSEAEFRRFAHQMRPLLDPDLILFAEVDGKAVGFCAKALVRYRQRLLRAAGRPQVILSTVGCHTITGLEAMLQALLMGDKLVLMPRFDPLEAVQLVERERVTILIGVPMAYSMMLTVQDLDRYDLSSLLICGTGGAPCPPELAREMQERFGCAVHIGFGTTELAGGIAATSLDDSGTLQAETVGQAMPGMEIRIVDEQRRELPTGQVGELACRGENVMLGYYRAPEKTAEVVDEEGWYYTGDLALVDERSYLRIVGRKDDVIIRAGVNIYPAEIERYLEAHEKIKGAAVVGVPAPIGGERTWAFIILVEGAEMTAKDVLRYCRAELEAHKVPDQVRFVADFPRAASGKPQKFLLREIALQEVSRK